jgi:hypothetical protein
MSLSPLNYLHTLGIPIKMAVPTDEVYNPSRLSRAFKRLSLKTAFADPVPLAGVVEEARREDTGNVELRRFSMSFFRPPTRLSTFSSVRSAKKTKQDGLNLDSKVDLKLDCSNDDHVYRPGDTMRGRVMLDARDMEGKPLRSVKVRLEGRAKM